MSKIEEDVNCDELVGLKHQDEEPQKHSYINNIDDEFTQVRIYI